MKALQNSEPANEQLSPCPFCLGAADYSFNSILKDMSMICCQCCGATAHVSKWNRRKAHPAPQSAQQAPAGETELYELIRSFGHTTHNQSMEIAVAIYDRIAAPAAPSTPEVQVEDSVKELINLIDTFAELRHTQGHWTYNTKSQEARNAVIAALKGE